MLNTINRTPAFKSLLMNKEDVKKLPESIQKVLKPGSKTPPFSLGEDIYHEYEVEDGDKGSFVSPGEQAKKLKGKLLLDPLIPEHAKNYNTNLTNDHRRELAIAEYKVNCKAKGWSERYLKREFKHKYGVILEKSNLFKNPMDDDNKESKAKKVDEKLLTSQEEYKIPPEISTLFEEPVRADDKVKELQ